MIVKSFIPISPRSFLGTRIVELTLVCSVSPILAFNVYILSSVSLVFSGILISAVYVSTPFTRSYVASTGSTPSSE